MRSDLLPILKEAAPKKSGPSYTEMVEAVRRVLRALKPGKNRKETIKLLGKALVSDPILMDWFYSRAYDYDGSGKLDSSVMKDTFGLGVLANWKDRWELSQGSKAREYDDLSSDPDLLKIVQSAVSKHKPTGEKLSGINWSEVEHLHKGIDTRIGLAQLVGGKELDELKEWVANLQKELEK
jgi:hypothetical protein